MKKLIFAITLLTGTSLFGQEHSEIRVASYNLRYDNPNDGVNKWNNRRENIKALVLFHDFDIFGTQEGLAGQLNDLLAMPDYACVGAGRDDGLHGGEHSAIFYRKSRFTILDSGNFWLSETPDVPGRGWDATCCNRICSWVLFRDSKSNKEFYFFNVHFDHQGVVAQKESGKLMVNKIGELANGKPVICTGDFNSTPDTEQIATMQTVLNDTYKITAATPYGPVGTFNGFRFDADLINRIDYIFVSAHFKVRKYAVLTDTCEKRYPSDHLPVVVNLEL